MAEFDTLNELVRAAEGAEESEWESPQAESETARFTELPEIGPFVNQTEIPEGVPVDDGEAIAALQPEAAAGLAADDWAEDAPGEEARDGDDGYTEAEKLVNRAQVAQPQDPVDVIRTLLGGEHVNLGPLARPGRKNVFDDYMRGRLVSLLGLGLSLRQAGAALSVSHMAIWKALKRDGELLEEVNKARFRAQIEPLTVIIRASKHDWRAATWLMKHLQTCMTARDESPKEE